MIKRYIKYIVYGDHIISHIRKTLYYHSRYYIVKLKIFFYYKKNNYPQSRIFLNISVDRLEYTEFTASGHRDISSRNVYKIIGKVIDGDWDLNRTPIHNWNIYKGLKEFLLDGKNLKETVYFRSNKQRIPLWYGITEKNYSKEVDRNATLFRTLKENGYKSQKVLGGPDPLDEIRVKIGRDGVFLWENSIHRFVMAKLLSLNEIPVVVTVRHLEWIKLKRKLIALARKEKYGDTVDYSRQYGHPDLSDIPYCPKGEELIKKHMQKVYSSDNAVAKDGLQHVTSHVAGGRL